MKNEHALELIAQCIRSQDPFLDLGRSGLTETDFEPGSPMDLALRQCTHLHTLVLSNQYWDFSVHRHIESRNKRNNNKFTVHPPALTSLRQLSTLVFSGDYDGFWPVGDISFVSQLPNLRFLNLSCNRITGLKGLENLVDLEFLEISNNLLEKLECLDKLTALRTLNISYNKIGSLAGLENLTSLENLWMHVNGITDVGPVLHLPNLEFVNIGSNPVTDTIPPEVVEVGWQAIKDRLLSNELPFTFREIKILLLGNPNVGKSNLLEYLSTGRGPGGEETPPTHGIQYRILDDCIGGSHLHCWDFGGQDYLHDTHQLFFSPGSLNIVLWSREDIERINRSDACFSLPYWFRCIELLATRRGDRRVANGKPTEVVVCENKIDLNGMVETHFNPLLYIAKFKALHFRFASFSLKYLKRTGSFKEILEETAAKLYTTHSGTYKKYLERIRSLNRPVIRLHEIDPENKRPVQTAMQVFHNMGILLYFYEVIPDKVFARPQELLDLLYVKILGQTGKPEITLQEIAAALDGNALGLSTDEIVGLLKHFDLVFQIAEDTGTFFVPQYLRMPSGIQQELEESSFRPSNIRVESDTRLMNLAMLKVFTAFGKYVKKGEGREYFFWKDGIIIKKDGMQLMIKFNREAQMIELFPGSTGDHFPLQKELVDFILDLEVSPQEMLQLPLPAKYRSAIQGDINWDSDDFTIYVGTDGFFIGWNQLVRGHFMKNPSVEAYKGSQSRLFPGSAFSRYVPEESRVRLKKVFVSYSHLDKRVKDKFVSHLTPLLKQGLLAEWDDSHLASGQWAAQIEAAMGSADICLLLVTPAFLSSKYIGSRELTMAYKRFKEGKMILFPVICKDCDWKDMPVTTEEMEMHPDYNRKMNVWLGKFLAYPENGKAIYNYPNKDKAWLEVINDLKKHL